MRESAYPSGRVIKVGVLQPLGRWDCGFESPRGHGWICHAIGLSSLEHYIAFSNTDLNS